MKSISLAVLLLSSTTLLAKTPPVPPNPADYTIPIHVTSSHLSTDCGDVTSGNSFCWTVQHLTVSFDGHKYELEMKRSPSAVLAIGDYKAKLVEQKNHPLSAYDLNSIYEFLLPDGITRQFTLVGITE